MNDVLPCGCVWSRWHDRYVSEHEIKQREADPEFHRPNRWLRLSSRWNESLGRLDDSPSSDLDQSDDPPSRSVVESDIAGS